MKNNKDDTQTLDELNRELQLLFLKSLRTAGKIKELQAKQAAANGALYVGQNSDKHSEIINFNTLIYN